MTNLHFVVISYGSEKEICPKSPCIRWGNFGHILVLFSTLWKSVLGSGRNPKYCWQELSLLYIWKKNCLLSVLNVCWNIKENIQKSSKVAPLNVMLCSMAEIDTSTSQEHCTVQVTTTLLTTLLPDRVTFIFPSREIVTALGNRIYFFSSPQKISHFRNLLLLC